MYDKYNINSWNDVEPYYKELYSRSINSLESLEKWIEDRSKLYALMEETYARAYINLQRYTDNKDYEKTFINFTKNILPEYKKYNFALDKKLYKCKFRKKLPANKYGVFLRNLVNQMELFREKNIPLETEEVNLSSKYGKLIGSTQVEFEGKKYTLQKINLFLTDKRREKRKNAWLAKNKAISKHSNELDNLFDNLKEIRTKEAKNAGFNNYRDYMFRAKNRFDYTPEDCYKFHESVKNVVIPKIKILLEDKNKALGIDKMRPWDKIAEGQDEPELRPFKNGNELLEGVIRIYDKLDPEFANYMKTMKEHDMFDLDSRKGKAPGGFNYPLQKTGMPFIFMNAIGLHRDVVTLLHEGGHATHTFRMKHIPIIEYRHTPSEVAELASMTMELLTMDYWDEFYKDEEQLKKAKSDHLYKIINFFPWCMSVDKFQHWIYLNPSHTPKERNEEWNRIAKDFSEYYVDWAGYEEFLPNLWYLQLHIFEVPFYYIEYGMAQLGALQMWRNYKKNPKNTIERYKYALSLGNSKPIKEIYNAAGIKFGFDESLINEITDFAIEEYRNIK
ncbi:M3 family oligoendopeptidase [candidate division TA06 bacterium]|uniref:M3 family oligoendopeptidase n=1 Tax=candidate division TA06 bacterium TaxID=2250710 RepID=A0A660S7B3_UNCT6|nr:MAG: M3 family oligoendopeptidase [candidate division TA06 bacterium]